LRGQGLWGRGFLVVVLVVPLNGAVVAQHHLPQRFAQVCQAGYVAVRSDVLPTGGKEKKDPMKIIAAIFMT